VKKLKASSPDFAEEDTDPQRNIPRSLFGGIALIIPFAIPVLLCELLVGQAAASINVDVLNDHLQTPAAIGLLVGVGLVAMNATIARAFTRNAAVHT